MHTETERGSDVIRLIILLLLAGALYFCLHAEPPDVRKDIRAAQKMWEDSELNKFLK